MRRTFPTAVVIIKGTVKTTSKISSDARSSEVEPFPVLGDVIFPISAGFAVDRLLSQLDEASVTSNQTMGMPI